MAKPDDIGQRYRVTSGPFLGFEGWVTGQEGPGPSAVVLMLDIFGRDTPTELERTQLEPLPAGPRP
jgi:transcription antitermination factor NusG